MKLCHRKINKFHWNFLSSKPLELLNTSHGRLSPGTLYWVVENHVALFLCTTQKSQGQASFRNLFTGTSGVLPATWCKMLQHLHSSRHVLNIFHDSRAALKSSGNFEKCLSQVRGTRRTQKSFFWTATTHAQSPKTLCFFKSHPHPSLSHLRTENRALTWGYDRVW